MIGARPVTADDRSVDSGIERRARDDFAKQRREFALLRETLAQLRTRGHEVDTLSMGMTHDLEAAIAEGATMVRIGTAIFGERPAKVEA